MPGADDPWLLVLRRLVPWSIRRHRLNAADAEEIVQEAVRQFLAGGSVVDASDPKALLQAIGSRINGIAVDMRRKKALRAVGLTAEGRLPDVAEPEPSAERGLRDDTARRAVAALLARAGADELVRAIVEQFAEGVDDPAQQARALGRHIREVYNARRRLVTHVAAVRESMESW